MLIASGLIGGAFDASSHKIALSYKPVKRRRITSHTRYVYGSVRYLESAPSAHAGTATTHGRNIYFPSARIAASGEWGLKSREQAQQFQLVCEASGEIYIDGTEAV